jgi:diguanylate cyclase
MSGGTGNFMVIKIGSKKDVVRFTAIITLLTVFVPVVVSGIMLWPIYATSPEFYFGGIGIAALIPMFITPPIAFAGLHMLRLLTATIERIDDHVRFDALTGVYNRGHFLDRVRASRSDGMVLIIDVDHFKTINDTYGHEAGDEVLKSLGALFQSTISDAGLVGRLGGEEFGVFLPSATPRIGAAMAHTLCDAVREYAFTAGEVSVAVTISVGGATHLENLPIGHSLKIADERLYAAKQAGRDRYMAEPARRQTMKLAKTG